MKKILLRAIFWVIDLIFKIKLYRAMKEKEFDNLFNGNGNAIEEVTIEPSQKADSLPEPEPEQEQEQEKQERRGRKKTELRAHAGRVYRVEVDSGLVQEIDGKKIPKTERKHFSDYVSGNIFEQKVEVEGKPLNIPADLILNFAIVPLNNHVAEKTKDELKLKIGTGLNPEREKAAADLAELLSKYIAEKTRVANPNEVILATSAILFAAPLAVSYSTNKKEDA